MKDIVCIVTIWGPMSWIKYLLVPYKLSLCMYILHTSTELHHVFSKHALFYIFYPSVILLCTDDIFVSLHISSTVYIRLGIIYNVPRTQNILLCFYPNKHLYVLHINRLWLQLLRWITVLSVTKKSYSMIRLYIALVVASISIEIAVAY